MPENQQLELQPIVFADLQPPMNITLVTPESGLPELSCFVAEKLRTKGTVGFDTETNFCKDFYFRFVRTLQVGDKDKQFVIDMRLFVNSADELCKAQGNYRSNPAYKPVLDILEPMLCSNTILKVGQNLSFEYQVMFWNFGLRIWNLYSTDLAERAIQAGTISLKRMTEFSMAAIVARRFKMKVDKDEQTGFDLDSPLTQSQIEYAAFDARMPLAMREHQLRQLTVEQLMTTAQIENDALVAYQDMHLFGLNLDGEKWMKRIEGVLAKRQDELKYLDAEFIKYVGRKTEQIDFVELGKREDAWRNDFEKATAEELAKAEEVRMERDKEKKVTLKMELGKLEQARRAKKAAARAYFLELSKRHTKVRNLLPDCEGEAFINYGSNDQLLAGLQKIPGLKTLTSVADDNLLKFNDKQLIQVLRKYRKGKKDTGTYGEQWARQWTTKACKEEGWRHPWDNRIHATWNQLEAETGRSSSQKPSVMNLPRVNEVRECFICDPPDETILISNCCEEEADLCILGDGVLRHVCRSCKQECLTHAEEYIIITVDMSGAELRIIAELANATSWIEAFRKGHDVHSVSTEILEPVKWKAGALSDCAYYALDSKGEPAHKKCKCPEHVKLRENTKAINFLLCYGGGPDALADELDISVDMARDLMKQHEAAFPEVWGYLRRSGDLAQERREARDLYGRRRSLPAPTWEIARQYYIDEHPDRLELDQVDIDRNIAAFKAANLREPKGDEKYICTHRPPNEAEIKQAMKALWASIGRRGKNHEIQGSNASIIKRAMGCGFDVQGNPYLWHILWPKYKAKLLSMIHDELLIQAPKRHAQKVAEAVADAFKRAAAEVMSKVIMEAEWHIAPHWQK